MLGDQRNIEEIPFWVLKINGREFAFQVFASDTPYIPYLLGQYPETIPELGIGSLIIGIEINILKKIGNCLSRGNYSALLEIDLVEVPGSPVEDMVFSGSIFRDGSIFGQLNLVSFEEQRINMETISI
jgi:hypothetical protein